MDTLMVMTLIEDDLGNEARRDRCAELWDQLDKGDSLDLVARHFDWVIQPSLVGLGMASERSEPSKGRTVLSLDLVREIRDIVLGAGVSISARV